MSDEYLYDLRDGKFVLFEQLRIQRLFELPQFSEFTVPDIEMILAEGLKFCQKVLSPANTPGDQEGCHWENGKVSVPKAYHSVYKQQCESGWMAMSSETEFGGQGMPFAVGAALGEMFVGANPSLSMVAGLTRAAAELLAKHGTPEMKQKFVHKMIAGEWGGTMCLTEPQAGTGLGDITTSAHKRDGKYYVRGQKIFISGGEHDLVDNIIHLVLARCEGASPGTKGLSLFVIPKHRVGADGKIGEFNDVACAGIEHKMGINGSPTCQLVFGENDRCEAELIGEEEQGIRIMFDMMNSARIGVGLQGVAMGSWAYLLALNYARTRIQSPEMKNVRDANAKSVPIVRHPDVRRMLATMKGLMEGGRALLLHTSFCLDLAEHSPDAEERERMLARVELFTPICKAWCSDTGYEAANLALQTYGGHGYLHDYPVEQIVRDCKIASIYEGTNGVQAIDLLGRKVGRKGGATFLALMADIQKFIDAEKSHAVLGPAVAQFAAHKEKLEATTMNFAMQQMSGDQDYPLLSATPYLRMFGNVAVAWLLLEQGTIAHTALERLASDRQAKTDEARRALIADNADARYYDNKIKTAQFFVSNLLSQNEHLAALIASGDRSPLEMSFEE